MSSDRWTARPVSWCGDKSSRIVARDGNGRPTVRRCMDGVWRISVPCGTPSPTRNRYDTHVGAAGIHRRPLDTGEISGQVVALLVVQREIEAFLLALGADPKPDQGIDRLEDHEAHDAAVDDRHHDAERLEPDLLEDGDAVLEARAAEARVDEDARQDRADDAADAVDAER